MEPINNYTEIQSFITQIKGQYKTIVYNYFENQVAANDYIGERNLFYKSAGNSIFLYKKIDDYYKIYFFSPSYNMLQEDLKLLDLSSGIIVCDLYGKELTTEYNIFVNAGFCEYGKLYHYIKKNTEVFEISELPDFIRYADLKDIPEIWEMICKNFNKYLDINIHYNQLARIITSGKSLVLILNNKIAGFYILDIYKGKAYSYYSFVERQYRNSIYSMTLMTKAMELLNQSKFISGYIRNDNRYIMDFARMDGYISDGIELIVLMKNNDLHSMPVVNKMNT